MEPIFDASLIARAAYVFQRMVELKSIQVNTPDKRTDLWRKRVSPHLAANARRCRRLEKEWGNFPEDLRRLVKNLAA